MSGARLDEFLTSRLDSENVSFNRAKEPPRPTGLDGRWVGSPPP